MSHGIHRINYDAPRRNDNQPALEAIHIPVEREDRPQHTHRDPPRVTIIENEEDRYNIPGRYERRDPPRVRIRDNDGDHYIIRGREREAEPTYTNAQTTASKYYEGHFGDRAWRKKKLERISRGHSPPKREPPQSSK
jgi:hypothetical protein